MITAKEREVIRDLAKKLARSGQPADYGGAPQALVRAQRPQDRPAGHRLLARGRLARGSSPRTAWSARTRAAREIEWTLRARIYRAEIINDDVPAELRWDCRKLISDTGWALDGHKAHNAFTNESVHVPTISTINPFWRPDYTFDETAAEFEPLISDDDMEDADIASRLVAPKVI